MEPEPLQPEVAVEDEARYLRRQKPLEIKRRKFGRRAWREYARVLLGAAGIAAGGWLLYQAAQFLLFSPRVVLAELEQIEVSGNRYVSRGAVLEKFAADRGRSTLRMPLEERRRLLEEIPWVESASCQRILPNRIRVELVERTPVAFLRQGTELALVDAQGVVLERPRQGDFRFPVVAGIHELMPRAEREQRLKLYVDFLKGVELARPGSSEQVSEVDLSDASDLRATLAGLPGLGHAASGGQARHGGQAHHGGQASVLVHFGNGDFQSKFRLLVENIGEWRASAGRVESVDLRFDRQVVVNPEGVRGPEKRRNSR